MASGRLCLTFLLVYWKSIFMMIYPLTILPIFLVKNESSYRCLYVVVLMAGLWVVEPIPLPVTSLLPMVLFPLMGILDSDKTSMCYLKSTTMMFMGEIMIVIAIQHCNLHTRVALYVIKFVGCSPRRLNLGLVAVTMFVSMWISNTATTAMMVPVVEATLQELETQGILNMYEPSSELDQSNPAAAKEDKEEQKRPTKPTMCYFISTAFAATIGGSGSIVGSSANLTFKGIYETRFPNSPGVQFDKWMMLNVPMMLARMGLAVLWLQFWFMGLFRPNSKDAKNIAIGKEGENVARSIMIAKIEELGKISFHEIAVGILFVLVVMLWFFRHPQFGKGWPEFITDTNVKDATAAFLVVILLFLIPARPNCFYVCSNDEEKRPTKSSAGLITWKVIQQKMPWGLLFLLGGGFAIAEGAKSSGMSGLIADNLKSITSLPMMSVMFISSAIGSVLTQFLSSNTACVNILLPVLAEMAVAGQIHPLFLMMPTTLACTYAYFLPVSTPPNAIAAAPCNLRSTEMMKCGVGVYVISMTILFAVFPWLGKVIWDFDNFPDWASEV